MRRENGEQLCFKGWLKAVSKTNGLYFYPENTFWRNKLFICPSSRCN